MDGGRRQGNTEGWVGRGLCSEHQKLSYRLCMCRGLKKDETFNKANPCFLLTCVCIYAKCMGALRDLKRTNPLGSPRAAVLSLWVTTPLANLHLEKYLHYDS